eukprot:13154428-Alexandrium_andersonii.AAC.1
MHRPTRYFALHEKHCHLGQAPPAPATGLAVIHCTTPHRQRKGKGCAAGTGMTTALSRATASIPGTATAYGKKILGII